MRMTKRMSNCNPPSAWRNVLRCSALHSATLAWAERGRPRPSIAQKKLAEPEGSAKFEQGGFTSRRRKDPKTLFPGASPGNLFGPFRPQKLSAIEYRAG